MKACFNLSIICFVVTLESLKNVQFERANLKRSLKERLDYVPYKWEDCPEYKYRPY